jgi:predicted HicB family RNase H-like nuclease
MKYKGYTGVVEFDEESGTLCGRVVGLRDFISFEGESVAEVTQAFHDSVDVYLELCAERGESPEKPFSGQFVLRIDPQLHRVMSHAAEEQSTSLNSLIEQRLKEAFGLAGSGNSGHEREARAVKHRPRPKGAGRSTGMLSGHQPAEKVPPSRKGRSPRRSRGSAPGEVGKG